MNYVTSFIGKPPEYWVLCIKQIRLFVPESDAIYCITDSRWSRIIRELSKIPNVHIVKYKQVRHRIFNEVASKYKKKFYYVKGLKGRELLFLRALERFFLCENLMELAGLRDAFFLEIDNLLYADPGKYIDILRSNGLSYMRVDKTHDCSGVMYIRDCEAIKHLNEYFLNYVASTSEFLSEMIALSMYGKEFPDRVSLLPIHPVREGLSVDYTNNFEKFQCVFDPSIYGQFLFGQDAIHTNGKIVKGFKHPTSDCDITVCQYTWELDEKGRRILWARFGETEKYPVFNIHFHAKNLIEGISWGEQAN